MFTIEVKKREKDEEFSLEDLELSHGECFSGRIKIEKIRVEAILRNEVGGIDAHIPAEWELTCQRCKGSVIIAAGSEEATGIAKTSIDGKKRKVADNVCVTQKPETKKENR